MGVRGAMLGMIADDLTGACDAGVQFGGSVVVLEEDAFEPPAAVTVITTDSRVDPPEVARAKVGEACLALGRRGIELVYKKIDSTLLGNVIPEIEGALDATGIAEAWICPAFPEMGRTVSGGWLYVWGERRAPVPTAARIRVFDAVSGADLVRIAEAAACKRPRPLLVGSAGLARGLASLRSTGGDGAAPRFARLAGGRGVLVCAGSENPIAAAQVAALPEGARVYRMCWDDRDVVALTGSGADVLVLTGGDTARRVCRILGARAIRLACELMPGIPLGYLIGGAADGAAVITKAGGFGDSSALVHVMELIA